MTPEQAIASVVTLLTAMDKKLEAIDWKLWEFHKKLQAIKMSSPATATKEDTKTDTATESETQAPEQKKSRSRKTTTV